MYSLPVVQYPALISEPHLVIEGVAQLVPHDNADRAVVDAPRVLWTERESHGKVY